MALKCALVINLIFFIANFHLSVWRQINSNSRSSKLSLRFYGFVCYFSSICNISQVHSQAIDSSYRTFSLSFRMFIEKFNFRVFFDNFREFSLTLLHIILVQQSGQFSNLTLFSLDSSDVIYDLFCCQNYGLFRAFFLFVFRLKYKKKCMLFLISASTGLGFAVCNANGHFS